MYFFYISIYLSISLSLSLSLLVRGVLFYSEFLIYVYYYIYIYVYRIIIFSSISPSLYPSICLQPWDASFYSEFVAAAALRQQQKAFRHQMLEHVDSYLWGNRSEPVAPQLLASARTELKATVLHRERQQRVTQQQQQQHALSSNPFSDATTTNNKSDANNFVGSPFAVPLNHSKAEKKTELMGAVGSEIMSNSGLNSDYRLLFDYQSPLPTFHEDAGGHWGVRLEVTGSECLCCSLPIELPEALESVSFGSNWSTSSSSGNYPLHDSDSLNAFSSPVDTRGHSNSRDRNNLNDAGLVGNSSGGGIEGGIRGKNNFETLVAFRCGHVYHANCVPHMVCDHCFSQSFTSVYTPPPQIS